MMLQACHAFLLAMQGCRPSPKPSKAEVFSRCISNRIKQQMNTLVASSILSLLDAAAMRQVSDATCQAPSTGTSISHDNFGTPQIAYAALKQKCIK